MEFREECAMFGKMMNNYYYGKSGKGDFRKDDLPETRWQLFWDTLKTRLSGLVRLNLMYAIVWIPTIIVLMIFLFNAVNGLNIYGSMDPETHIARIEQPIQNADGTTTTQMIETEVPGTFDDFFYSLAVHYLLILIPCIAITGPATAGVAYVTRNWSRDEHAFIWSDFKDALKGNWKQALPVSIITGCVPLVGYMCWKFYGAMALNNTFMMVPQVLCVLLVILWALSVTYMYPVMVTYELKMKGVMKNSFLLGIARLPMSVAIRLLHCLPIIIAFVIVWFFNADIMIVSLILAGYYVLIGFALSRFVTASYANAVFDKYINSHIEGATVNRGLRQQDDDDDEEEEEE